MERIEQHQVGIRTLLERGVPRPPTNTSSLNASSKMGHTAQGFQPQQGGMKVHTNEMNRTQSSFGGTHSGNQWLNQAALGISFSPNGTGRSQQSAPVGVIGVAISPNNRSINGGNSMNQSQMSHVSNASKTSGASDKGSRSANNTREDFYKNTRGGPDQSPDSVSINVDSPNKQTPMPGGVSPIDENEEKYAGGKAGNRYRVAPNDEA